MQSWEGAILYTGQKTFLALCSEVPAITCCQRLGLSPSAYRLTLSWYFNQSLWDTLAITVFHCASLCHRVYSRKGNTRCIRAASWEGASWCSQSVQTTNYILLYVIYIFTGMAAKEKVFPMIILLLLQFNYLIHYHHVQAEQIFVMPI